jgi:hypothetical protein
VSFQSFKFATETLRKLYKLIVCPRARRRAGADAGIEVCQGVQSEPKLSQAQNLQSLYAGQQQHAQALK